MHDSCGFDFKILRFNYMSLLLDLYRTVRHYQLCFELK